MSEEIDRWGVELNGADPDKEGWRAFLKPPFDPYVEEVKDERGDYLALRSSIFNGCKAPDEVHKAAKRLFKTLNVVMSTNTDADPVSNGAVIEYGSSGQPRKHHFLEVEGVPVRVRVGIATLTVTDAQGNVIEPPAARSKAQLWMRAASLEPQIGSTLDYLDGKPGWVELYKAYEALKKMPDGGISNSEIDRFTHTANAGNRHHPGKVDPPKRPMELWEARALITRWVTAAIENVLANSD